MRMMHFKLWVFWDTHKHDIILCLFFLAVVALFTFAASLAFGAETAKAPEGEPRLIDLFWWVRERGPIPMDNGPSAWDAIRRVWGAWLR